MVALREWLMTLEAEVRGSPAIRIANSGRAAVRNTIRSMNHFWHGLDLEPEELSVQDLICLFLIFSGHQRKHDGLEAGILRFLLLA